MEKPVWKLEEVKHPLLKNKHCFILNYKNFFCRFFYADHLFFGYVFINKDTVSEYFDIVIDDNKSTVKHRLELAYNCYAIGCNTE